MFDSADLANMRESQEDHMQDECHIQAVVITANSMNEQVESWPADGAALACGLDMRPGSERHGANRVVVNYDATLRLPITATPDEKDRIKVTKRFGETLSTPLVFDIISPIQRGPSGIRIMLKKIEV